MSGHVVNIPQLQAAYNAAKAGVIHLGKSFAVAEREFGRVGSWKRWIDDFTAWDVALAEMRQTIEAPISSLQNGQNSAFPQLCACCGI